MSTDELIKLKELLDSGVITQKEFNTKKKAILRGPDVPKKKKGKGCLGIILIFIVISILIGKLGTSPKNDPQDNVATATQESADPNKKSENTKVDKSVIKSGQYEVGKDIPAGEYKIFCDSYSGYIEATKDTTGNLESIIFNENFNTFIYAILSDGQFFKMTNCYAIPIEKAKKFDGDKITDGQYKIGVDIPAGEYNLTANDGESAYLEVNSTPYDIMSIVTNDNFNDNRFITVSDGQYLKLINCTATPK